MKKTVLAILIAAVPAMLAAQNVVIDENFDSYADGDFVAQSVGAPWTTWSNAPGTAEDTPISNEFAASGANSMKVSTTTAGGGPTDMVLQLGDQTTGQWALSWNMYIPTGQGGYFNMQHTEVPGTEWAIDVAFPGAGNTGTITTANMDTPFDYVHDQWFAVTMVINLSTMQAAIGIGNSTPHIWAFNSQSTAVTGMNQIGGINFFAFAGGVGPATYYIDDVLFIDMTGVGIEEVASAGMNIYPNPVNDILTVEAPGVSTAATTSLVDATGRTVIAARQFAQYASLARTQMNLSGLPSGLYFLRVQDGNAETVRRVTKF